MSRKSVPLTVLVVAIRARMSVLGGGGLLLLLAETAVVTVTLDGNLAGMPISSRKPRRTGRRSGGRSDSGRRLPVVCNVTVHLASGLIK